MSGPRRTAASDAAPQVFLGMSAPLTGSQFFIRINHARATIGLHQLADPPELRKFGPNPVGETSIKNTHLVTGFFR